MMDRGQQAHDWQDDVRFVRALVRGLVRDESCVDDVVQETALASLAKTDAQVEDRRAWLAAVARNLARRGHRGDRRRRRREQLAARGEATPGAAEAVERLELIERVIRAVRRLEEPYRSSILYRYFDEWSVRRIARHAGAPESTIRTRLSRALARIREDLDRHDKDRTDWRRGLLPFALADVGSATSLAGSWKACGIGSFIMSIKVHVTSVAAAMLAILAVVLLLLQVPDSRERVADRVRSVDADPVASEAGGHELPASSVPAFVADGSTDSVDKDESFEEDLPFAHASLFGRVVDVRRFPLSGIDVVLELPGLPPMLATSDRSGRFELERVARHESRDLEGSIRAIDQGGDRIGIGFARLTSRATREASPFEGPDLDTDRELDLGTLVLERAFPLTIRVVDGSDPVSGARVAIDAWPTGLRAGSAATGAEGEVRVLVPEGDAEVEVRFRDRFGRSRGWVPDKVGTAWVVSLEPSRTIDVLAIDGRDGSPLPGVEVQLVERRRNPLPVWVGVPRPSPWRRVPIEIAPTDADGRTRVDGVPPNAELVLYAEKWGYAVPVESGTAGAPITQWKEEVEATTTSAHVTLVPAPTRTVRVPVVADGEPLPADGISIELQRLDGTFYAARMDVPETARMEGGDIVIDGVPGEGWMAILGVAPDGRIAPITIDRGADVGHETCFRSPRSIELVVREASGTAVEGAVIDVRDQGGRHVAPPIASGPSGIARLDGLFGDLVEVWVWSPDRQRRVHAGTFDLAVTDASIDVELPTAVRVSLDVSVNGEPGFPPRYRVHSRDIGRIIPLVGEDPATGRMLLDVSRDGRKGAIGFSISAEGYHGARLQLEVPEDASEVSAEVDFRTLDRVFVTVVEARDSERRLELTLEGWNERRGRFVRCGSAKRATSSQGLRWYFTKPDDGVYRIVERWRGVATEPIDMASFGPGDVDVTFDLDRGRNASEPTDRFGLPRESAQSLELVNEGTSGESAIHVRLSPPPGSVAPRIVVGVTPRDHPGATRRADSNGRVEHVAIRGLAAGAYDVVVNHQGHGRTLYSGTVVLDGERDETIDIDL